MLPTNNKQHGRLIHELGSTRRQRHTANRECWIRSSSSTKETTTATACSLERTMFAEHDSTNQTEQGCCHVLDETHHRLNQQPTENAAPTVWMMVDIIHEGSDNKSIDDDDGQTQMLAMTQQNGGHLCSNHGRTAETA